MERCFSSEVQEEAVRTADSKPLRLVLLRLGKLGCSFPSLQGVSCWILEKTKAQSLLPLPFKPYLHLQTMSEFCKAVSIRNTNAKLFSIFCQCSGQSQNQLLFTTGKPLGAKPGGLDLLSLFSLTYRKMDSSSEKTMFCDFNGVIRKVKMASHVTSSLLCINYS